MEQETVTREEMELVGIETRASNENPEPIGELWGRFFSDRLVATLNPSDDVIIAVYCGYEGDHTQPYTFFLGRRVAHDPALPEGLAQRKVRGGKFARFVSEGEQPQALMRSWQEIWKAPLARRYEEDYELHRAADPRRIEIFVGI